LKQEPGHEAADTTWTGSIPQVKPGDTYQYLSKFNGQVRKFADPRSQQLTGSKDGASSVVVDPSFNWSDPALVSYKTPNFNEMVIYELHIGSFNPASGNKSFNFAGAIEKLDYLKQLGVNAIEVLPVHENPEFADHTPPQYDWGYDPVQLFAIESSYGTPQDFKEFVKQSHRRGIAVIVDVVYNHMSGDNLLKQFGGWSNGTNPDGIYFYDKSRSDTGFGPRMDYGRSQVRSYIQDNALMYLREYQARQCLDVFAGISGRWITLGFNDQHPGNEQRSLQEPTTGWCQTNPGSERCLSQYRSQTTFQNLHCGRPAKCGCCD